MKCDKCGQTIPSERSLAQHNLYWGVVNFLWFHQRGSVWQRPYNLHQTIKMCIGYTEPVLDRDGEQIGVALKSTNFMEMPQKEFNEYFSLVKDFIWAKIALDDNMRSELIKKFGIL